MPRSDHVARSWKCLDKRPQPVVRRAPVGLGKLVDAIDEYEPVAASQLPVHPSPRHLVGYMSADMAEELAWGRKCSSHIGAERNKERNGVLQGGQLDRKV